ncbi:MAG TPA: N-acetyltransferase [Bacillus bacterium]|uniref:Acyltransferase n=1 Tax=Siminovitchia fordii TaxID=254759 RepID=A0ABQ4K282_9BACI|nr:N-acetyltransferase [Siminovitchia fordii]GIN19876.1 acyltransferase [Siminovitchia fordii]HBZ09409.1 N-acetyltransferase [Bacillus sp. (in: firmicutes)]
MIDRTVKMGSNVKIGEYVIIERNAVIGDNVTIGHHVVIKEDSRIGNNVTINDHSILGQTPVANKKMARKPPKYLSSLVIGDDVKIGSQCVIYRGTTIMDGVLIGDLAAIREKVTIGNNSIVGRNVMVENNTQIGQYATIQTSSYVTAYMVIEDYVFIGPCLSTSNDKYIGTRNGELKGPILRKGAKVGNNASILPGIIIGEKATVGAGAVVTKDVKPNEVVVGNPARPIHR